jgi:large subunit ribosomal protein L1
MAKATTKNVPNDELDAMLDTPEEQAAVNEVIAEADNIPEISEGVSEDTPTTTAKAGKRSAKALEEVAAKEAKEERKASGEEAEAKPKQHANPTRPRVERQGKKFQTSAKLVEVDKLYALGEAIALAQKTSHVKFDATVELHINLGVDPRHADQNIRDNLVLPAGTGRTVRIAVLTDDPITAIAAGANVAGTDEVLAQLDKGLMNFDILISTPALMAKLGKFARVLGPRGLMPNPKSGTVTTDVTKAVNEAKAGKVEYRVDSTGIVHLGIGKVSFTAAQLNDNAQAVLTSIKNNKPASVKGNYFKAIHMTTSMGPSIAVDISAAS